MDLQTAHTTLGVTAETPLGEVRQRYRMRAQMLHPDRLQGDGALAAEASRAMADLNVAWETVREADERGYRNRATVDGPDRRYEDEARLPGPGECDVCGVYPAKFVQFSSIVGMLLFWRTRRLRVELCRSCGVSMFREVQAETLTKGWWGIFFAYVANTWAVVANLVWIRRHVRRVGEPEGRDARVVSPMPPGLPLSPPLHRRPGPIIATSIAVVLLAAMGYASSQDTGTSGESPNDGPTPTDQPTIVVGTCFDQVGDVVDCGSESAFGVVVSEVVTATQCVSPQQPITVGSKVYCVLVRQQ